MIGTRGRSNGSDSGNGRTLREKLYEITNDRIAGIEQRLVDVLELGVEYLDVDQAHLVAIDPEAGR